MEVFILIIVILILCLIKCGHTNYKRSQEDYQNKERTLSHVFVDKDGVMYMIQVIATPKNSGTVIKKIERDRNLKDTGLVHI